MPLARLMRRRRAREKAYALYDRIVARARQPVFFDRLAVPDTVDGRFELVALHAFLVLHRLKAEHGETAEFGQILFDVMFTDFDRALREMGTGDLSVGKEVKRMAQAFYGRVVAYERGIDQADEEALDAALRRNLYGTAAAPEDAVRLIADYVRAAAGCLAQHPVSMLLGGDADFGPLPEPSTHAPAFAESAGAEAARS